MCKNEEVNRRVKEERNMQPTIKRRKANWVGYVVRRNGLLKHVMKGKTYGTVRRGKRRKGLPDHAKKTRKLKLDLKSEALDRTLWGTGFKRGYGPVVRQRGDDVTA